MPSSAFFRSSEEASGTCYSPIIVVSAQERLWINTRAILFFWLALGGRSDCEVHVSIFALRNTRETRRDYTTGYTTIFKDDAKVDRVVAVAYLYPTQAGQSPALSGTVLFTRYNDTFVNVSISVTGIASNVGQSHGIHVHQYGDLTDLANGASLGSHYNPLNQPHGCPYNQSRHLGDMGNWDVDASGNINQFKLSGTNSIVGLGVVMHSGVDDCAVTTSAGSRVAVGVVGVANVANNTAAANSGESSFDSSKLMHAALTSLNATCSLIPTNLASTVTGGYAFFSQNGNSITVAARYDGINTTHANHVHTFGDLRDRTGTGAGGHFNPTNSNHSIPPLTPRHAGDLGNVFYTSNNTGYYYIALNDGLLSLSGVNSILGRALILHQNADNCGQPTGTAGSRYAYCVIGLASPTTVPVPPSGLDYSTIGTQDTSACPAA
ncbi:copper/zinc superoxide dismutase-like, partial [Planoprotostelium fungivorum]